MVPGPVYRVHGPVFRNRGTDTSYGFEKGDKCVFHRLKKGSMYFSTVYETGARTLFVFEKGRQGLSQD